MKEKIAFFIFFFLFSPLFIFSCFFPTDYFAIEILLNKPQITYNLNIFEKIKEDQLIRQKEALIYRSHFNSEVAVILRETEEKKLSVRIQIPTRFIETQSGFDLKPAVNIDPENFNWKEALKTELIWLRENKIIEGLSDEDLKLIYKVGNRGNAGHNAKIVWGESPTTNEETWLPYNKTKNPLLLKGLDCGGFSISLLPKEKISLEERNEEKICRDFCGDGICQEIVCMAQGCPCPESSESCPQDCKKEVIHFPNPAAVFCKDLGYTLEIRKNKEGNEYGVCIFPDGKECDEWAFYEGKCGQDYQKIKIDLQKEPPIFIGKTPRKIEEFSKISSFIVSFEKDKIPIQIEIDKEKKLIKIKEDEIFAISKEPIKIEHKILKIETSKGEVPINISPKEAIQIANKIIPQLSRETVLKIENNLPLYEIRGIKQEKLFGIFKINLPFQVFVDASSGAIVKRKMNFLIKVLDFISF